MTEPSLRIALLVWVGTGLAFNLPIALTAALDAASNEGKRELSAGDVLGCVTLVVLFAVVVGPLGLLPSSSPKV
jgi:hypothetical protein